MPRTVNPTWTQDELIPRAAQGPRVGRTPTYWALLADPRQYRVVDAIADREIDLWATGRHDVREGDWAVIWKAKAHEDRRGVVALAEVISGPQEVLHDVSEWLDDSGRKPAMRVTIRYTDAPDLPLWLGGPSDDVLRDLTVSRAAGGGVFRVTPAQWARVLEAAGSVISREALVEETVRTRFDGQGFMSDVRLKLAIERHAVALATQHFEAQGWLVEDVGSWACFDLCCRRGAEELHVEVKGTTGAGATVSLTANEIDHAETYPHVALVVVTHIAVHASPDPLASPGKVTVFDPWHLDRSSSAPGSTSTSSQARRADGAAAHPGHAFRRPGPDLLVRKPILPRDDDDRSRARGADGTGVPRMRFLLRDAGRRSPCGQRRWPFRLREVAVAVPLQGEHAGYKSVPGERADDAVNGEPGCLLEAPYRSVGLWAEDAVDLEALGRVS